MTSTSSRFGETKVDQKLHEVAGTQYSLLPLAEFELEVGVIHCQTVRDGCHIEGSVIDDCDEKRSISFFDSTENDVAKF